MLQKVVWAGANLGSFPQAVAALRELAGIELSAKQVRRMTEQVGQDRHDERQQEVAAFKDKPLMERLESPADVESPELGVVMMDGGRYQRRDHFGEVDYDGTHWKEDKVGILLSMQSEVHPSDPHPEFPVWLARADVIAEIASLGAIDQEKQGLSGDKPTPDGPAETTSDWDQLTPRLHSKEVIASSESGREFGHHLEYVAWKNGVVDASRTAFVADGASVNWTIYKQHFSHMTGILDLMHALSYAWKVARALDDPATYERHATWIWQGEVEKVIDDLESLRDQSRETPSGEIPSEETSSDERQDDPVQSALVYFVNHRHLMNYPRYRQQGLPLTSSHIESTIKQINIRMKGSEKFFRKETGETLLQLRADSLCDTRPLARFWPRWFTRQNGANTYRKQAT